MKLRRKTPSCLNCGYVLDKTDNFCPKCGQENSDSNLTFGMLMHDFFANTLAFDSKIFNSFFPFLFKPGYLSAMHKAGKRATYVNPLRIYLIISLIFFFFLSITISREVDEDDQIINLGSNETTKELTPDQQDSLRTAITKGIESGLKISRNDSIINFKYPTNKKDTATTAKDTTDTESSFSFLNDKNWKIYQKYHKNDSISDEMLLDSLNEKRPFARYLVKQMRKVQNKDTEMFVSAILKNIPVMMFILIPIFALTLKLLYIRNRQLLYINHLIHGVHLHTYSYFIYTIAMIIAYYNPTWDSGKIYMAFFGIATVYSYFSFYRFYQQGWFKTLIKFLMVGYIYLLFICIFLVAEMFVSFLLY